MRRGCDASGSSLCNMKGLSSHNENYVGSKADKAVFFLMAKQ